MMLRLEDVPTVGGKNASLGQMIGDLGSQGIQVPFGFAITADGYWHFLHENKLVEPIQKMMGQLTDYHQVDDFIHVGSTIRDLIVAGTMPD